MTDTYLIWSHEHAAWWGPDECGYTPSITLAGRYTHLEALRICGRAMPGTSTRLGALPELPVRLEDINRMVGVYVEEFGGRDERWR